MWQEHLGPAKAMKFCPIEQPRAKACRLLPGPVGGWGGGFPSPTLCPPSPAEGLTLLRATQSACSMWNPTPPPGPHRPQGTESQHLPSHNAQSHAPSLAHPHRTASLFHFCKVGVGATDRMKEGLQSPTPSFWEVPGSSLPHSMQLLYRGKAGDVSELP